MQNKIDDFFDLKQFFYRIIKNWIFFVISIILCLLIAICFNRYSKTIFKVSTTVLFEDNSVMPAISTAEAIYSNDPFQKNSKNNISNKIYEISSYPIIYQTLKDLKFDIEYYLIGNIKNSETYHSPFYVNVISGKEKLINKYLKLTHINEKKFNLVNSESDIDSDFEYNKKINFLGSIIQISRNEKFISQNPNIVSSLVKFKKLQNLTKKYQSNLDFFQEQKKSSAVKINLKCQDEEKGVKFLNKLTENFIKNEIITKNKSSKKTVEFISKQLLDMQDSLEIIENKIQQFKENNSFTDLSIKAQASYQKLNEIESVANDLKIQYEYLSYLSKYIQSDSKFEQIIVPPTSIDENSSLRILIRDLIDVQLERSILINAGKIKNPAVKQFDRTTTQIISSLKEAITSSQNKLKIEIDRNILRKKEVENEINSLPEFEREMLKIERLQKINENIYTFFLRKRSEANITSSSNVSDTKVLEPAVYFDKKPFYPNNIQNYFIAILAGLITPLLYFLFKDILNDNINSKSDLESYSSIPIIGIVGKNRSKYSLLSNLSPKSIVYEGFRAIRSNLNFISNDSSNKVFLVTSSISGEGKTFFAENLSIVFARSSKRTVLIDADLRKPKVWQDFELENDIGLTNYLNGDCKLTDIVKDVGINNLDVILSGPVPRNPSKLLLSEKFKTMMKNLKKEYDVIIFDTPPLGLVADTLSLINYSLINLYIVRQDFTNKNLLSYSEDLFNKNRLGETYLVLNDVKEGSGVYGYSYGNSKFDSKYNFEYYDKDEN